MGFKKTLPQNWEHHIVGRYSLGFGKRLSFDKKQGRVERSIRGTFFEERFG